MRTLRWVAVASVGAIGAIGLLTGCTADVTAATPPPQTVTSTIQDLTLRHPASWRLVPVQNRAAGPSSPIAFLTDQSTVPLCLTAPADGGGTTVLTCGSPVPSMAADGVFIGFVAQYLVPQAPSSHNRVLDGHLATVAPTTPEGGHCPSGATDAVEMKVFVPDANVEPPGWGHNIDMVACYAGPDAAGFDQEIGAVIDSIRFA